MLTLMSHVEKDAPTRTINVEKDAATRTNTGKTEKETRPNQPARDQPAREPSPPTSMSTTTYRNYMTNYWKSIITELYVILLSWVELDLDLYCVLLFTNRLFYCYYI